MKTYLKISFIFLIIFYFKIKNINCAPAPNPKLPSHSEDQHSETLTDEERKQAISNGITVAEELTKLISKLDLTSFEGDPILVQKEDALNDLTVYKLPRAGKKDKYVYETKGKDAGKEAIVLLPGEDNFIIRSIKKIYIGLRKSKIDNTNYHPFYIFLRDSTEQDTDTNTIEIGGHKKVIEYDTWEFRPKEEKNKGQAFGWNECASSIFVPCSTNETLGLPGAKKLRSKNAEDGEKKRSKHTKEKIEKKDRKKIISIGKFKTEENFIADEDIDLFTDLEEALQEGRKLGGAKGVSAAATAGFSTGVSGYGDDGGIAAGLKIDGAVGRAIVQGMSNSLNAELGTSGKGRALGRGFGRALGGDAGAGRALDVQVGVGGGGGGGLLGGILGGGGAGGGGGGLLGGILGGGGAGGGGGGILGGILGGGGGGGAAGGGGGGLLGGILGGGGGGGLLGGLLGGGGGGGGPLGMVSGLLGGLVSGVAGIAGAIVQTASGIIGLAANLIGTVVKSILGVGMGLFNSVGSFGGLGTPAATPVLVGPAVGIKDLEVGVEVLPEYEEIETLAELENPATGGLGGLLEIDVDLLAVDEIQKQEAAKGIVAAEPVAGLEDMKVVAQLDAPAGDTSIGVGVSPEKRKREVATSIEVLPKDNSLPPEKLEAAIKLGEYIGKQLFQTDLYIHPGWKTLGGNGKPGDTLSHESDAFVGFGACKYQPVTREDWENAKTSKDIIHLIAIALRTNCITKEVEYYKELISGDYIEMNQDKTLEIVVGHKTFNADKMSPTARSIFTRAYEMSIFSHAFRDEFFRETPYQSNEEHRISRSVFVLGQTLLNGIDLSKSQLRHHHVKILRNLAMTAKTAFMKLLQDYKFIHGCTECTADLEVNLADQNHLMGIMQLIIHGLAPVQKGTQKASAALDFFAKENKNLISEKVSIYTDQ